MKTIVLTVLLVVMQAPPPGPRQATSVTTSGGKTIPENAERDARPDAHRPSDRDAQSDKHAGLASACADKSETTIIEPARTQKPSKDWWDKSSVILAGILALVGGIGVVAALKTLTAVQGQVQAQLEALRARLTISFEGNPFRSVLEKDGILPKMVAKIINTGGTPAYEIVPESWIEFLPMPFVDFTPAATYFKGDKFPVYPTQPIFYPVQLDRSLSAEERQDMASARLALCLRIRLSYQTLGKPKYCDFAFCSEPNGIAQLPKYSSAD